MQVQLYDNYFMTGSASGSRTYQVTSKGRIVAIEWVGVGISASATAMGHVELSRSGLETCVANDPQGIISHFSYSAITTGSVFGPFLHIGMNEAVSPGERLFLNVNNMQQFTNKTVICVITIV